MNILNKEPVLCNNCNTFISKGETLCQRCKDKKELYNNYFYSLDDSLSVPFSFASLNSPSVFGISFTPLELLCRL